VEGSPWRCDTLENLCISHLLRFGKTQINDGEERKNRQDLIELFKIFKGLSRVRIDELFMLDENTKGTRDHCLN